MTDNPFDQAKAFDRLEELVARGVAPGDPDAADLKGELQVIQLLMAEAEEVAMPRDIEFTNTIMGRIKPRKRFAVIQTLVAMAAAFVLAFIGFRFVPGESGSHEFVVDHARIEDSLETLTRDDMIAYLNGTERLLMSIRDHDAVCGDEGNDMALERQVAQDLLLKQKRFASQLAGDEYNQARRLFASLESILVDVKNMDPCTDPFELELINDHISNKRILGKLRLIAQEIQWS